MGATADRITAVGCAIVAIVAIDRLVGAAGNGVAAVTRAGIVIVAQDGGMQTAAGRVDSFLLVQGHDFLIHELGVVFMGFADLLNLRSQSCHFFHGFIALIRQAPEGEFDGYGKENNRQAEAVDKVVEDEEPDLDE